jgi:hypothetical protein
MSALCSLMLVSVDVVVSQQNRLISRAGLVSIIGIGCLLSAW